MWNRISTFVINCIGVISGAIGIWQGSDGVFEKLGPEALVAVKFICFMCGFFMFAYIFKVSSLERPARYADSIASLNRAFDQIHVLASRDNITQEQILEGFTAFCNEYAKLYKIVTKKECCVSIKFLFIKKDSNNDDVLYVKTLSRDLEATNRLRLDENIRQKQEYYLLSDNTAYLEALDGIEKYFFHNYLPWSNKFISSHFQRMKKSVDRGWNPIQRYFSWPLPYKSGMVAAIVPPVHRLTTGSGPIGFLCIDSSDINCFNKKYDLELLRGSATGLYNTLNKFKDLV